MPPKKNTRRTVKEKTTVKNVKGDLKFSNVYKEYFTNQLNAKAKIIARLKDDKRIFENNIKQLENKTNELNVRFEDEYSYVRKIVKEKNNVEKKLKADIEDLKQQYNTMVETGTNKLKGKDDEFVREAGAIETATAVYAARLNGLKEFLKQEKTLREKCEDAREQARVMDETYELRSKNADENYRHFKHVTEKRMLRLYADVVLHLRKQSTSEANPVKMRSLSVDEMNDFKDMMKWMRERNAMNEANLIAVIDRNKRVIALHKSNAKNIDDHLDAYLDKKNTMTALRRELNETQTDVKNRRSRPPKKHCCGDGTRPVPSKPLNDTVVHASRAELRAIRAAVRTLDDRVRTTEDVLLKVYDEALDHVEEMKVNNKNCEQKTIVRIQKFYDELKHFVPQDLAMAPCRKNLEIQKNQYINNYHPNE